MKFKKTLDSSEVSELNMSFTLIYCYIFLTYKYVPENYNMQTP